MAELQPVSMNNAQPPKFGMLLNYKAEHQKSNLINNSTENPLFSTHNFKMPEPGVNGNIFG